MSSGERRETRGNYLEQYASEIPSSLALSDDEQTLTWAAWNEQANRLADALERRGVRAGDRIAVRMMNRCEWFVTDAALAKLGAVRVAVSHRLQASEVRYLLEDSKARGIFFDDEDGSSLAPAYRELPHLTLAVGVSDDRGALSFRALLHGGRATERFSGGRGATAIVYTSGTTGRPKGVHKTPPHDDERRELTRRLTDDLKRSLPFERGERNLLCAPLNHAAAPASALGTHVRAGTVYLLKKFEPEAALALIARHRITTTFLVPTMLSRIMSLPAEVRARYDVSSVRAVTTGASLCPSDLKRKVTEYFGPCLYENYGSTETGVVTMFTPKDMEQHADSCGRILDGVAVRIVDDSGRELPRGEVGEIYVKSPVTIDTYYGETARGSDFSTDGYFTAGDVGKLTADGYLYILDRKKDMIIAGGVNIYPAEIEAALREHPAIHDVAVFGVPHPEWGEQVHAVCECHAGMAISEEELRAFMAERLAQFKQPRTIQFVAELPRNVMGKVLKRELRDAFWAGAGRVI